MSRVDKSIKTRILVFLQKHSSSTYRYRELSKRINIQPYEQIAFKAALKDLVKDGSIKLQKGNRYTLSRNTRYITGTLSLTQKGFGFVISDDGLADVFIGRRQLMNAVNGDRVKVKPHGRSTDDRRRGKIIEILERKTNRFVGTTYERDRKLYMNVSPVTPERGIKIINRKKHGVTPGQMIEARVTDWGSPLTPILVKVLTKLGDASNPENDFDFVTRKYEYSREYPEDALRISVNFNEESIKSEIENRRDLRDIVTFTIDPEEARDFDDAISIEQTRSGWHLGVHIADVSHYVRSGTTLDREAYERSTSVYFTEGVIHMLPESLSSNLCSLVPGKDRLTFSILMEFDHHGNLLKSDVTESVIHSQSRLTYEEVEGILHRTRKHPLQKQLSLLKRFCDVLEKQRSKLGSIDFDIPEPEFFLEASGIPHRITPKERLRSHKMVEECMLVANKTIAEQFGKVHPFVFRVHEKPPEDDIQKFLHLMKKLRIPTYQMGSQIHSRDIRKLLLDIQDSPFKGLIESVALRTMTKAQYSTGNRGHFGLAFGSYTHFTSPIRRYPDLLVHRRIKQIQSTLKVDPDNSNQLQTICHHANEMELKSQSAEREYIRLKQLRWLETQIGEKLPGIISGVMNFGFFVELEKSLAEGLVHITTLPYEDLLFTEDEYMLQSRREKVSFQLGDRVTVQVQEVIMEHQRANFLLIEDG